MTENKENPEVEEMAPPLQFGALIKERRKHARLTQMDLAELMHVTRNTVINWEADKSKPDYSLIPDLCLFLNIRLYELFHLPPEVDLEPLENRVVNNLRKLRPSSRRVVDKMVIAMVEEECRDIPD